MEVIQLNINHCAAAQDLLVQTTLEKKIDVAIISDPYRVPSNNAVWLADKEKKAAIWACGKYPIQQIIASGEDGFVAAKINGVIFLSCYAPPRLQQTQFEELLDRIVRLARGIHQIVIAGDFNAWATEWGSRWTNTRGYTLLDAFSQLDIVLANQGNATTFRKGNCGSIIDITFTSRQLADGLSWRVSEDYSNSDHQALLYSVDQQRRRNCSQHTQRSIGWASKDFDVELFAEAFSNINILQGSAEEKATHVADQLKSACDATMARKSSTNKRKAVYWWNDKIKDIRRKCLQARRKAQRAVGNPNQDELNQQYKILRKTLKDEIRESKRESFKRLIQEIDDNPWGTAYRIVMARVGNKGPPELCPDILKEIVGTLFPQHPPKPDFQLDGTNPDVPEVTPEEILEAVKKIDASKAPGPDSIPNKALRTAVERNMDLFQDLIQTCLEEGTFPSRWKRQKLVLIPKPGKPPGEPSSYRPICLLDTTGKILERIVQNRLTQITEGEHGLADNQFGFRKARSTVDAVDKLVTKAREAINKGKHSKKYCAIITLDVKNAFNTANWKRIMDALGNMGIPTYLMRLLDSYFKDRVLLYDSSEGVKEYKVSSGVPQGSVLGPILWNIMYNEVFKLILPPEADIIGFADDIAIVVIAKNLKELEAIANDAVSIVNEWLGSVGLELAEQKTEVLLISGRRKAEAITIRVGEHDIRSQKAVKYLGVMLDNKLSFKEHINYVVGKASRVYPALSRLLPNSSGTRSSRRRLLARAGISTMLYGAPAWAQAIENNSNRKSLERIHRLNALRVVSGYRTVSAEASFVISGMMPITLQIEESQRIYHQRTSNAVAKKEIKRREKANSLRNWQDRWDNAEYGRWTRRLIPNIADWTNRKHGEVNYYLTQILSGHGTFKSYLYRIGKEESPHCPACANTEESAEHVFFECPRFEEVRSIMEQKIGRRLRVENLVENMCSSTEGWDAVCEAASTIMKELSRLENNRRTR